ncbi:helix-turn-helix transcriptional regulator [Streptomyces verrucosisporus]|uniref:helix-turn-helix domain-containing protein n=1 Tax=Streptomyces verrucosisporus TaxID=1695161 RepID=UPI0019CFDB47|nr:helix-turn-helix transcriptional regulator [Streptomyces verrucosisporus]MBN3931455.1 helix-turn-helix transcriptional regulator [Streptomyces verrucosisporus]
MAARNTPTARQRRLATEMRRLREQAGLSTTQAAALLGSDRTMVSNIEAGRTGLSGERVRQIASLYRCPDPALVDALAAMAGGRRSHCWWEEYRGKLPDGFLDVSEIEHHAARIRTVQTVHLPGLLQTEDHARALFEVVVPELSRLEVELRVAHRLGRQAVLGGADPTPYSAVVHETALRMRFGSRKTVIAQLRHLIEAGERDNVTLTVIPFHAGGFPGADQSVLYVEGAVPRLDTVQLDSEFGPVFIDSPTPLVNYRTLLRLIEQRSLPPAESRDFIHSIARDV